MIIDAELTLLLFPQKIKMYDSTIIINSYYFFLLYYSYYIILMLVQKNIPPCAKEQTPLCKRANHIVQKNVPFIHIHLNNI